MTGLPITMAGRTLTALPSGALWDAAAATLCVSDLHLGKSDRIARRFGLMLPPYDSRATLDRLAEDVGRLEPAVVVCLGDSFDDLASAGALDETCRTILLRLQAGRRWIWIEGNHDPGPVNLGGNQRREWRDGALTYRHIADPRESGEISGHFHPKLALPKGGHARPCFLYDGLRIILPAYGTYTGGLSALAPDLRRLMGADACAILTGRASLRVPLAAALSQSRPARWTKCR